MVTRRPCEILTSGINVMPSSYPSLYQINTRVTMTSLGKHLNRAATLDDIPDAELARLAELGFDWVWFLGVWQTGPAGRRISKRNPTWQREYLALLPDLQDEDVCGSCFAVQRYQAHEDFGGEDALIRLRERVRGHGMRLMLDFVPNHTALDHPWVEDHPEFYVSGTEELLRREPRNYTRLEVEKQSWIAAHGRDPYFDGWPDTLQLNYAEPTLREAMARELETIAAMCDGVRCDMAMLVLPEVFERTWGLRVEPFWPDAISRVRAGHPGFLFMAEVYWDLEWRLQREGFDFTYDKRLYDRLIAGDATPVRDHLRADLDYQNHMARFLENHDEPRAAAEFDPAKHKAAAVVTFFSPGLRLLHQGQLQGWRHKIPVHLARGPEEETDLEIAAFYSQLLACLRREEVRAGDWSLLECRPAWEGNDSWLAMICFGWRTESGFLVAAVNYAPHESQCYVQLPLGQLVGAQWELDDLLGPERYLRDGETLFHQGLYLDLHPWRFNLFRFTRKEPLQ
jgi:hypothetical protein